MRRKWVNAYAPMFDGFGVKLTVVPENAVVDATGLVQEFGKTPRESVIYSRGNQRFSGFVYTGFLEEYIESLPVNCVEIANQTEDPSDAQQYALVHGVRQVNLCGQLCVSYILGIPLADLLAEWEQDYQPVYRKVFNWFSGKVAGGTGPDEVVTMFAAFEKPARTLAVALRDPVLQYPRYTVTGLAELAGRVICSVKINKYTGRLAKSGILHWVVVTNVNPERSGGKLLVYNPFSNRIEDYSWDEFKTAAGAPYGVVYG